MTAEKEQIDREILGRHIAEILTVKAWTSRTSPINFGLLFRIVLAVCPLPFLMGLPLFKKTSPSFSVPYHS